MDKTTPAQRDEHSAVLIDAEQLLRDVATTAASACTSSSQHFGRVATWPFPVLPVRRVPAIIGASPAASRRGRRALLRSIEDNWSGLVNVVNDEPIRLADLADGVLRRQGLAAIQWSGETQHGGCNRRISNHRLKDLGYVLRHPTILDQRCVLVGSQVP